MINNGSASFKNGMWDYDLVLANVDTRFLFTKKTLRQIIPITQTLPFQIYSAFSDCSALWRKIGFNRLSVFDLPTIA